MSDENKTEEIIESPNQERSPRGLDSREATQRKMNWENESNLPDPEPQDGWVFRWIRTSLLGIVIILMYQEGFVKDGNLVVWRTTLSFRYI